MAGLGAGKGAHKKADFVKKITIESHLEKLDKMSKGRENLDSIHYNAVILKKSVRLKKCFKHSTQYLAGTRSKVQFLVLKERYQI